LSDLGQYDEALAVTVEAVELCQALARRGPNVFLPEYASSLHKLSTRLFNVERYEEALSAASDSVALYRALAQRLPDTFQPDLALGLRNLGIVWGRLERHEEALKAMGEAVALYRALAQGNPGVFLQQLARCLTTYHAQLISVGRYGEAVDAAAEAIELHRALDPGGMFEAQGDLVSSLGDMLTTLLGQQRQEEALATAQLMIDTLWPFAESLLAAHEYVRALLLVQQDLHEAVGHSLPVSLQERMEAFARLTKPSE